MALKANREAINKRGLQASGGHAFKRWAEVVGHRWILASVVFVTLLATFAVEALSSAAATVPTVGGLTVTTRTVTTTPSVSAPTVTTVTTTPAVTTPAVTTPPVTTPDTTPAVTTPAITTPAATTSTTSVLPPAGASSVGSAGVARAGDAHTPISAAARQRRLRRLVVGLSQCLVALQPQAERVLLLRAGIATAGADSPAAVARATHISRGREARVERGALGQLQSAAHENRCPSRLTALIHVPPQDRLVSIDPVLTIRSRRSVRL
jgi:hypothetical protein